MTTYYKIVERYKDRLFSLVAGHRQMNNVIRKRKRGLEIKHCKEYRPGHWACKVNRVNGPIAGRLFIFGHLLDATHYMTTNVLSYIASNPWAGTNVEIWECEAKNPLGTWECESLTSYFNNSDGYVLADAVKLTKHIKSYKV